VAVRAHFIDLPRPRCCGRAVGKQ